MEPVGQYVADQGEPRNFTADFFAKVPSRSIPFIGGTVTMGIALLLAGLFLLRSWNQISPIAISGIGLAMISMVALWNRAYVTYRRLNEVYSQGKLNPSFIRSPLDAALRNAAVITSATLYFSFFIAAWLLVALTSVLHSH
jgi:hypothetical protein